MLHVTLGPAPSVIAYLNAFSAFWKSYDVFSIWLINNKRLSISDRLWCSTRWFVALYMVVRRYWWWQSCNGWRCQLFVETFENMLTFDWHCNLSFTSIFLWFLLVLLQPDAVSQCSHTFSYISQLFTSLLEGKSHAWIRMKTSLKQTYKMFRIVFLHTGHVKRYSIDFELWFILVVVKFRSVKSHQLKNYHGNREEVRLIRIIFDLVLHIVEMLKLLWRKDKSLD